MTSSQIPTSPVQLQSPSVRQRASNINIENPDVEFLRTALSACRSTITQQEAELTRLKESLDIRNKRILQLESQVGHASGYIAGRESTSHTDCSSSSLQLVLAKLENIEAKIAPNSNNIVINSCIKEHNLKSNSVSNAETQTDPTCSDSLPNTGTPDHLVAQPETHLGDSPPSPTQL